MDTMKRCPTCRRPLPDLAAEKTYNEALLRHDELLTELAGALGSEGRRRLDVAAGEIYVETVKSIRVRLTRLRPELADLIALAVGTSDPDWLVLRQPWEGKEEEVEA